ncbi:MAG: hypothetical protein Q4C71_04625 [Microbacteriaceae bacterium]|nr:hypothetical protein [Microbacteriaceae bacterium]
MSEKKVAERNVSLKKVDISGYDYDTKYRVFKYVCCIPDATVIDPDKTYTLDEIQEISRYDDINLQHVIDVGRLRVENGMVKGSDAAKCFSSRLWEDDEKFSQQEFEEQEGNNE